MLCYLGPPAACHGLISTPVLVPPHDALVVLDPNGDRGKAPCLPKTLYEPGAVGGPLDPYHRPILAAAYGGP